MPKCIAKQLFKRLSVHMIHHVSRFSLVYVPHCAEERLQSSSQHRTRHGEVHLCSACLAKSANESLGSELQHVPLKISLYLDQNYYANITVDSCVKDTFPAVTVRVKPVEESLQALLSFLMCLAYKRFISTKRKSHKTSVQNPCDIAFHWLVNRDPFTDLS